MKTISEGGNAKEWEEWEICTSNQKELAQKLIDFWAKYTGMELVNECEITGVIGGWKEWRIITENQLRISGIIDAISLAMLFSEKISDWKLSGKIRTVSEGGNAKEWEEWEICTSNQKKLAQKLIDFWAKYSGMELVNECEITGVIGEWKEWRIITENQIRINGIIDVISQAMLLRDKMSEKTRAKRGIISSAAVSIVTSIAAAFIYDAAKLGIDSIFKENKDKSLPRSAIVAFIEDPDRRLQNGIYKTYKKFPNYLQNIFIFSGREEFLPLLQGKRLFDEEWSENEVDITDEQQIILLLQLWSLLKYVGYENKERIYTMITEKWEKLELRKGVTYGNFWTIQCRSLRLGSKMLSTESCGSLWTNADKFELQTLKETYPEVQSHLSQKGISFFEPSQ